MNLGLCELSKTKRLSIVECRSSMECLYWAVGAFFKNNAVKMVSMEIVWNQWFLEILKKLDVQ